MADITVNITSGDIIAVNISGGDTIAVDMSGFDNASYYMQKSVYDSDGDGQVDSAASADSVDWGNVAGKPSVFTPAGHNQAGSTIILDTSTFNNILSSADDTAQKALEALDEPFNQNLNTADSVQFDTITIANNIDCLNSTETAIQATKSLKIGIDGDEYGPSNMILQNRTGMNGARFSTKGSPVDLIDFRFETNTADSAIRTEGRSNFAKISAPEMQFGKTDPVNNPNFVVTLYGNIGIPKNDVKFLFGAGKDCGIWYDGTNMHIDARLVGSGTLILDNLPIADPGILGAVYNDSGVLKISI